MLFAYKESCVTTVMALLCVLGVSDEKARFLLRVGQRSGQAKSDFRHLDGYMSEAFGQEVADAALSILEASEEESRIVRDDG